MRHKGLCSSSCLGRVPGAQHLRARPRRPSASHSAEHSYYSCRRLSHILELPAEFQCQRLLLQNPVYGELLAFPQLHVQKRRLSCRKKLSPLPCSAKHLAENAGGLGKLLFCALLRVCLHLSSRKVGSLNPVSSLCSLSYFSYGCSSKRVLMLYVCATKARQDDGNNCSGNLPGR